MALPGGQPDGPREPAPRRVLKWLGFSLLLGRLLLAGLWQRLLYYLSANRTNSA